MIEKETREKIRKICDKYGIICNFDYHVGDNLFGVIFTGMKKINHLMLEDMVNEENVESVCIKLKKMLDGGISCDAHGKGEWIQDSDTLRCSNCGFGYFPTDYFFKDGKCISASTNRFIFKYCPECGREMEV